MNLNMIRPRNENEDFLLSRTKNCDRLMEQVHRKAEEILEYKNFKSKETFHFNPPVEVKEEWMIGFTALKTYKFVFNITEENNKFEL